MTLNALGTLPPTRGDGETGKLAVLKSPWPSGLAGSNPARRTKPAR